MLTPGGEVTKTGGGRQPACGEVFLRSWWLEREAHPRLMRQLRLLRPHSSLLRARCLSRDTLSLILQHLNPTESFYSLREHFKFFWATNSGALAVTQPSQASSCTPRNYFPRPGIHLATLLRLASVPAKKTAPLGSGWGLMGTATKPTLPSKGRPFIMRSVDHRDSNPG
jgi:hypothetical protein